MEKEKATKPKANQNKSRQIKSEPKTSASIARKTSAPKTSLAKSKTVKVTEPRLTTKPKPKSKTIAKLSPKAASAIKKTKLIVGSLELCNLPELGISDLQIRVDTGAKTSSLHVNNIIRFKKHGKPWVSFDIHPDVYHVEKVVNRDCAIHDVRKVKSSNGVAEERYVIKTLFNIGGRSWPIEITLTDRSDMSNLMLLGRQGMKSRMLVDPSKTFLMSNSNE